jgi:hypothetical protein
VAKAYPEMDETLRQFMQAQPVFFVAPAPPACGRARQPLAERVGPVPHSGIAYLDIFGRGVETIVHLQDHGRIGLMFWGFQGAPKVLRLHGQERVVETHAAEFAALQAHFPVYEGRRAIIAVEVTRISDSCGYGVPLLKFGAQRAALPAWCRKRGTEGLKICQEKNRRSMDGLPGVEVHTND